MKLTKLLTLSQFVDLKDEYRDITNKSCAYDLIQKYNNFLKQSITKDIIDNIGFDYRFIVDACYVIFIDINGNEHEIRNLSDLAEKTNGELKLKNIEL